MDFKKINIMVGIAALFSNSYRDELNDSNLQKILKSHSKIYTVLTTLKDVIPKNLKGFKEYDEYAHSLMISNSSKLFLTKDVGNNFVIYMIPHHEAAIILSIGVLKYTKNTEVKNLADRIVHIQKKEVEFMQKLLEIGELRGNANEKFLPKMKKLMMKSMKSYSEQANNAKKITKSYLQNMIIHHERSVSMAKEYLKFGKNKELIKMCNGIILSQDEEIKEMKQILKVAY